MTEDTKRESVVSDFTDTPLPKKKTAARTKLKKVATRTPAGRKKSTTKKTATRNRAARSYPPHSLEEALSIPIAIREHNHGHPWATEDVAQASLGLAKTNNRFFYLAAAARDYGLTIGTRDTETIELSELGRDIVFASNEATKRQRQIDAFMSVDVFKRVFDHYGGSANLPKKEEFLRNALEREFGIDDSLHKEFAELFRANCEFLGIQNGLSDRDVVRSTDAIEHPSDVRVVGQPKGKFDRTAFVIMPFVEKGEKPRATGFFNEVLTTLITPAANEAGFAVETADISGSEVIQSTIIEQLVNAQLVIADLSDHNPNVLFELGIRIAKELPVALIKAEGTGSIFDVDNMMRVLPYNPNLWPTTVKTDIPKIRDHIKATWDNRTTVRSYMQILTGRNRERSSTHEDD